MAAHEQSVGAKSERERQTLAGAPPVADVYAVLTAGHRNAGTAVIRGRLETLGTPALQRIEVGEDPGAVAAAHAGALNLEEFRLHAQRELVRRPNGESEVVGEHHAPVACRDALRRLLRSCFQCLAPAAGHGWHRHQHDRRSHIRREVAPDDPVRNDHFVVGPVAQARMELHGRQRRRNLLRGAITGERERIHAREHVGGGACVVLRQHDAAVPGGNGVVETCKQVGQRPAIRHCPARAANEPVSPQKVTEARHICGRDRYGRRGRCGLADIRSRCRGREALELWCDEKVQSIAHDGAAQDEAELFPIVGKARVGVLPRQPIVAGVREDGPVQLVGSAPGNRVDERAREVAVPNVVRGKEYLVLLDGLD